MLTYSTTLTKEILNKSSYSSILGNLPLLGDRLPRNQVFSLLKLNTYDLPHKAISNYLVIFFRDDSIINLLAMPMTRERLAILKLYLQESYSLPTDTLFTDALTIYVSTLYPEFDLDSYPSLITCITQSKRRYASIKTCKSSLNNLYDNIPRTKGGN